MNVLFIVGLLYHVKDIENVAVYRKIDGRKEVKGTVCISQLDCKHGISPKNSKIFFLCQVASSVFDYMNVSELSFF